MINIYELPVDEAREYERGLREGDGGTADGGTGDPSHTGGGPWRKGGRSVTAPTETRDAEMPRVVGPSAEFVPEG